MATAAAALSNGQIAAELKAMAQRHRAAGENPYKSRAYLRAAEVVGGLGESVAGAVHSGMDLTVHPGIGRGISAAIRELVAAGKVSAEAEAAAEFPGLMLYDAAGLVPQIETYLRERCGVSAVVCTGEFRRRCEVVHGLSFVVNTRDLATTARTFAGFGGGTALLKSGKTEAAFRLYSGLPVILRAAPRAPDWGKVLVNSTGSDAHLAELAKLKPESAGRRKPTQPVPARAETDPESPAMVQAAEQMLYRSHGLEWIPPELREGRGETALARAGKLPRMVSEADIVGDLHLHTVASDGAGSIEEMAEAAAQRGYQYLGISDHSQSLKIAGGVSEKALLAQIRRIDRLNAKGKLPLRLLKSAEVDILADGQLDYPDALLRELDYTICSIHSRFRFGPAQQTERLMRAMDNRYFNLLGHATGRLLLRRPGYEFDVERVGRHARERGCCFEINCSPDRLDLSAENARLVASFGVKIAICTDAHREEELAWIPWGVNQARRAGLSAAHILNTRPWPELQRHLSRR